jgi:hypothetical protein
MLLKHGGCFIFLILIVATSTPAPARQDSQCDSVFTSTQSEKDLAFLDKNIDPNPETRAFHGRRSKDAKGRHVIVPNPIVLSALALKMNLIDTDMNLLANFIANRDKMTALGEQLGHEQTRCQFALSGMHDDARLNEVFTTTRKELLDNQQALEDLISDTLQSYHELESHLGKQNALALFAEIRNESATAANSAHTPSDESTRKAAKEICERGLRECKFPEGLPANCASFLNMRASEIMKRCPNPGRIDNTPQ